GTDETRLILEAVEAALQRKPDIVLISAYTMYVDVCAAIAARCSELRIPVIAGGNSFVIPEIAERWANMEGISVVFSGEPEPVLHELVCRVCRGEDVTDMAGVYAPEKRTDYTSTPLKTLDDIPFPDFSDFPW